MEGVSLPLLTVAVEFCYDCFVFHPWCFLIAVVDVGSVREIVVGESKGKEDEQLHPP